MPLFFLLTPRLICSGGCPLARTNFSFKKRQKELERQKKQEEKRQRRLAKKSAKLDDSADDPPPDDMPAHGSEENEASDAAR
jgi:hypothetical protein